MNTATTSEGDRERRAALVIARRDASLVARAIRCVPMLYAAGADETLDRPAHVRAASGLAWVGERLAVVQDDAQFVALVDPATGEAEASPLPPGRGGVRQFDDSRGNKGDKLDLEGLTSVPGADGSLLLAMGSGSTARREHVAVIGGLGSSRVTIAMRRLPSFFAALRETVHFAGSELNVEGVLYVDGRLRLFGRGNGAARGGILPVNATCDVSWAALMAHIERPRSSKAPTPAAVVRYDLGAIGGVPLSFTDAALVRTEGGVQRTLYTAAAESSPSATLDGVVAGAAIGVIEESDEGHLARWTELVDRDGLPVPWKIEGIAALPADRARAFVAIDRDEHDRASELCEVELLGPWYDGSPQPFRRGG